MTLSYKTYCNSLAHPNPNELRINKPFYRQLRNNSSVFIHRQLKYIKDKFKFSLIRRIFRRDG